MVRIFGWTGRDQKAENVFIHCAVITPFLNLTKVFASFSVFTRGATRILLRGRKDLEIENFCDVISITYFR